VAGQLTPGRAAPHSAFAARFAPRGLLGAAVAGGGGAGAVPGGAAARSAGVCPSKANRMTRGAQKRRWLLIAA
jgi:hypothetical protein